MLPSIGRSKKMITSPLFAFLVALENSFSVLQIHFFIGDPLSEIKNSLHVNLRRGKEKKIEGNRMKGLDAY